MMLPGFIKYIKIHNIDEESLLNAADYLNCIFLKKGEYIFHQLEESDAFYGIIRGKVSIQCEIYQYEEDLKIESKDGKKKKFTINLRIPRVNNHNYKLIEEILFHINDGYCFGEWGLVNDNRRSSSAKALEDTYLFKLEKKEFKSSLYHCFSKLMIERKNFIMQTITPLKEETLYEKISPIISPLVMKS